MMKNKSVSVLCKITEYFPLPAVIFMLISWSGSFAGCQAKIGDSCSKNVDCSPDGDRICDTTQPGGYCTVPDCQPGSCPDNAVCVRFWSGAHSRNYCIKDCNGDGDCRGGYYCAPHTNEIAQVLDEGREDTGYCIQRVEEREDGSEDEEISEEVEDADSEGI